MKRPGITSDTIPALRTFLDSASAVQRAGDSFIRSPASNNLVTLVERLFVTIERAHEICASVNMDLAEVAAIIGSSSDEANARAKLLALIKDRQ